MLIDAVFNKVSYRIPQRFLGSKGTYYTLQDQIGRGGNALVFECADEVSGDIYAIKFLLSNSDKAREPRFNIEIDVLMTLSQYGSSHIVKYIDRGGVNGKVFKDKKSGYINCYILFVVMEKASCSLKEFIVKNKIAPEIYVAQFRGLLGALDLLHKHAIHRDLKPENILVVGERWVISDFGICFLMDGEDRELTLHWQIPGPRFWMSPEANNKHVGLEDEICFASDVFQLAAIFWWVVNRRHPSGILTRDDWQGIESLFLPISNALQHSLSRRYTSASEFQFAIEEALDI